MSPKYKHDCERCKFLGTIDYMNATLDLYVCVDLCNPEMTDLIARESDEGSDYTSTTVSILLAQNRDNDTTPMIECWRRAVRAGLAINREATERHKNSTYMSEDILNAANIIEATNTVLHSTFIMSERALNLAHKHLSSQQYVEDYEKEFRAAVVEYLTKVIESR